MAAKKRSKKVVKKNPRSVAKKSTKKIAVKKKAAKSAPVVRQGDKAALVRALPRSLPASEVVERAAEKGMVISKAYVHNIRSAANKAARALMAKEGKKTVRGEKKKLESQFKALVVTLGPARAKKLLSQVETSLSLSAKK